MNEWVKFAIGLVVAPPLLAVLVVYSVWSFIAAMRFLGWLSGL